MNVQSIGYAERELLNKKCKHQRMKAWGSNLKVNIAANHGKPVQSVTQKYLESKLNMDDVDRSEKDQLVKDQKVYNSLQNLNSATLALL